MTSQQVRAAVITVSDRTYAGVIPDVSGDIAAEALEALGHDVTRTVIPDGTQEVSQAITQAVAGGAQIVLTTGGTGVTPRDLTPEGTIAVLERELPGVSEAIRAAGAPKIPTAVLSRGVAGTIGNAFVCNLPGSPGGVRDGVAVISPLLDHILDQLLGGNHD